MPKCLKAGCNNLSLPPSRFCAAHKFLQPPKIAMNFNFEDLGIRGMSGAQKNSRMKVVRQKALINRRAGSSFNIRTRTSGKNRPGGF